MPSRVKAIRTAVETHISASIPGVTITNEPIGFDPMPPKGDFPHAVVLVFEEDPERLDFKQERRRVRVTIALAVLTTAGDTAEATRETLDLSMEAIRDAIFADPDLGATVDDVSCEAAVVVSGPEDTIVYGEFEVITEEVF